MAAKKKPVSDIKLEINNDPDLDEPKNNIYKVKENILQIIDAIADIYYYLPAFIQFLIWIIGVSFLLKIASFLV